MRVRLIAMAGGVAALVLALGGVAMAASGGTSGWSSGSAGDGAAGVPAVARGTAPAAGPDEPVSSPPVVTSGPADPGGTTSSPPAAPTPMPLPEGVRCSAAWRPAVTQPPGPLTVLTVKAGAQRSARLGAFRLTVVYDTPMGDTPAVRVEVGRATTPAAGPMATSLYQLELAPADQFLSHGFTGLQTVRDPSGTAELQWWCQNAPQGRIGA
jgi:hypothetical protein